ncbi:hypothetical protein D9757_001973 [Collybiopsis confluens]|uniref:Uncharacterized protein n=1 Tax=Collybiopsis confluens TaxID=2823264 RepID=A0A8H5HXR9_9AGAR|nr:hypothetical protein D9757_001973 [Collybiopsis confluens]
MALAGARAAAKAQHILLKGIPILATTADIRRMLARHDLPGVTDVAILYEGFAPKKEALITHSRPAFVGHNLRELVNATLSGSFITSEAVDYSESGVPSSSFGTGPRAGMDNEGRNVLLSYFPSAMDLSHLVPILDKYQLVNRKDAYFSPCQDGLGIRGVSNG